MTGHNDLLRSSRIPPFLMAPGLPNPLKAVRPQDTDHLTGSELSRGVPRSPNRHLDQLRVPGQFEIAGRQIQFKGFPDVCAGFLLGFAS